MFGKSIGQKTIKRNPNDKTSPLFKKHRSNRHLHKHTHTYTHVVRRKFLQTNLSNTPGVKNESQKTRKSWKAVMVWESRGTKR